MTEALLEGSTLTGEFFVSPVFLSNGLIKITTKTARIKTNDMAMSSPNLLFFSFSFHYFIIK